MLTVCHRDTTCTWCTGTQPTVFVVDDDQSMLTLWKIVLTEELNCRVMTAASAEHALGLTFDSPPHLLILDFLLSSYGMNGIELYDTFKQRVGWQAIPAMMASATLPTEDVRRRGIVGIHKPFDLYTLLATVEKLLCTPSTREDTETTRSHVTLPTWEETYQMTSPEGLPSAYLFQNARS